MSDVADVRDRYCTAEEAADHRQARSTAVHLVELGDVRESPAGSRSLRRGLVSELLGVLRLGRRRGGGTEVTLGGRDLGGQDLVGEVERDTGQPLVAVLKDALLHALAELGVLREQRLVE